MTIVYSITAIIVAIALIALLLPRKVAVTRQADVAMRPEDVIARVASTEGFQTFNPYCTTDPNLKISPFGPKEGVGSGFHFEGKEGKAKRVSKYIASFKQLELEMNLKSNPVTSAQNFDHRHDFPDDRQTVACA